tara:strand:+ start:836 stop:1012 length:177 start_codon:yes stop_codon:yes gene_type:complete
MAVIITRSDDISVSVSLTGRSNISFDTKSVALSQTVQSVSAFSVTDKTISSVTVNLDV